MKSRFILSIGAALILICVSSSIQAQMKVLEGNEISFGTIYQSGEKVHEEITLENYGKEEIRISRIGTSCGCTAAILSDSSLVPGGKVQLNIEFNPAGYMGRVTKYIYISDSDPKDQLVTVKLTGYVAYALQPTPNSAYFTTMRTGIEDSVSVTLSNTSSEDIIITKVETPDSDITYKVDKPELKPGEFTDLHLYLDLKKPKDINGFVRVFSTSKLQPVLPIRISGGGLFR